MRRTLEHCSLITKLQDKPQQEDGKCYGFARDYDDDEPCDICMECKLNIYHEEQFDKETHSNK